MILLGLTGGIGSGKSTVSSMLAAKGAVIIDADAIVKELQEPGQALLAELAAEFGASILRADGSLDRLALAGIAFADKYRGEDHATLCMFGDGAARQGMMHETFNMAMTWKLPVIFIIENNNYAMGTSVERTSNVHDLSTLGESYDMPGVVVNGMSCEAVHEAIASACEHVRSGQGPILLDIRTYRYKGHSMSDPQKYRTKEEGEEYKRQDPI